MHKKVDKIALFSPVFVFLFLLCFLALPQPVSAATAEIKYSPLFDASLQNTIREFADKESGEYYKRENDAVTEKADSQDAGDTKTGVIINLSYGIPNIPKAPSIPSYTSSYSCGATCGATCGSTCGATCGSTCGATCNTTCGSTCAGTSSCAGSSTCFGSSSCAGASTCAGTSSCAGASTCVGTSSCAGSSTCFGTSSCAGASTCVGTSSCAGSSTCVGNSTCVGTSTCTTNCFKPGTPVPSPSPNPNPSTPLPETPKPVNEGAKPSSWAETQVKEAVSLGFVPTGLQKDYQSNITRREFCTLSIQFLKQLLSTDPELDGIMDTDLGESPFTDVDDPAVTWAYYLDIVSGTGGGKFNPNGQITRQEAAAMLTNMAENVFGLDVGAKSSNFGDRSKISDWAKGSVDFVYENGIMSGTGNNMFAPQSPYTREQSIVTILRMYDALVLE